MDSCATDLHSDDRIECSDSRLESLEVLVLVGEHPEAAVVDAEADPGMYVLFGRLKPRVPLRLRGNRSERRQVSAVDDHVPA